MQANFAILAVLCAGVLFAWAPAGVQYRILYFFQGNQAAVVSHGVIKRMKRFQSNPSAHTFIPVKGE
jgi:hypothetical protein